MQQACVKLSPKRRDVLRIDLATSAFHILVVGDYQHIDFGAALAFMADVATVNCYSDLQAVLGAEGGELGNIDLIVLAQSHPGQVSLPTADALHGLWPLAPMVGLLGSWCEGEMRSGQPWAGVVRVYWHQWQTMLVAEVEAMLADRSTWQRPRIMHQAWEAAADVGEPPPASPANVVVHARQPATRSALVDGLVQFGVHVWLAEPAPQTTKLAAVVYDAEYADRWMMREIVALRRTYPETPLLALLNFPRRDDIAAAIQAGACQVMSKPYRLSDVVACLNELQMAGRQQLPSEVTGRAG